MRFGVVAAGRRCCSAGLYASARPCCEDMAGRRRWWVGLALSLAAVPCFCPLLLSLASALCCCPLLLSLALSLASVPCCCPLLLSLAAVPCCCPLLLAAPSWQDSAVLTLFIRGNVIQQHRSFNLKMSALSMLHQRRITQLVVSCACAGNGDCAAVGDSVYVRAENATECPIQHYYVRGGIFFSFSDSNCLPSFRTSRPAA
jgi:hypothetical protein